MNLKRLLFLMNCMLLISGGTVYAGDCDGESGAAFGLCTAYCEAMDCDGDDPNADYEACDKVFSNYEKITGNLLFPCEQQVCPCYDFFDGAENWSWADPGPTACLNTDGSWVIMSDLTRYVTSYGPGTLMRCEGRTGPGVDILIEYTGDAAEKLLQHEACAAIARAVAESQNYIDCSSY